MTEENGKESNEKQEIRQHTVTQAQNKWIDIEYKVKSKTTVQKAVCCIKVKVEKRK